MAANKMTQSDIDALLKQSDFEDSAFKSSHVESRLKQQNQDRDYNPNHRVTQTSNEYGEEEFEDFEESKRTEAMNNNLANKNKKLKAGKSQIYDSYANEDFESYDESRRTKEFQLSQPNMKFAKKPQTQQLNAIQQNPTTKTQNQKRVSFQQTSLQSQPLNKNKQATLIKQSNEAVRQQVKSKAPLIKTQQVKQNKNLPYNYNRLQEREKDLLFTSLTEENKKLKQVFAQKDKQLTVFKCKYNILLQEKAQVLGNAKQATLRKQFQLLQTKYDAVLKQKAKERAYKTVSAPMSKTMNNNFVSQEEAQQREQQLMIIIEKLKQRLVSTDKELKTLQQKMNEGLDFQDELQRKLKRVEQLELRMEKMRDQAEQDRALIEMLKEKSKEQKLKIEEIQEQKNELKLCLKRAEMTQATQSDLKDELQQVRREKQMLQKSLRQISLNFTTNLFNGSKKQKKPQFEDIIQDSNQLLSYKK